jgi:sugar lactone lactonase YvrE
MNRATTHFSVAAALVLAGASSCTSKFPAGIDNSRTKSDAGDALDGGIVRDSGLRDLGQSDGIADAEHDSPEAPEDGGLATGPGELSDAAPATRMSTPMLTLVAGRLGGFGNIDGTGANARFKKPSGLAIDGTGNLFVVDSYNYTIRKIVIATGVVSTIAGSPAKGDSVDGTGAEARFYLPEGVACDGDGNLFVADSVNNTVRKIVVATGVVTTFSGSAGHQGSTDGTGTSARFYSPRDVAADGAGNLFVADAANNTIRKIVIATATVTTLAGSPAQAGSTDGTGAEARFSSPQRVTSDGSGNLFVADSNNATLRKIVIATGAVTTLAGSPGRTGATDGTGAAARFHYPVGIVSDGAGNLFVADDGNATLRKVVIATGAVTTFAGFADALNSTDGTGTDARFSYPLGLAIDGAGSLFVSDSQNATIRKVTLATGAVTTFAGSAESPGTADGTRADARFAILRGLVSDGAGSLFLAAAATIRRIVTATGEVTTIAGSPGRFGSTDGIGADARFIYPDGVAIDAGGNLFITDPSDHTIRKAVIATGVVSTLAGLAGKSGSSDGAGSVARFSSPRGVTSDGLGNLFVADQENHTIRKVVVATGAVTTLAGSPGQVGYTDGTGADARFFRPDGLVCDGAGNLFVADTYNSTIRKVVISTGTVTTLAGSPGKSGNVDGTGADARFSYPESVAADGAGNLYVADSVDNHAIRKIVIATGVVTTVVGSPGYVGV